MVAGVGAAALVCARVLQVVLQRMHHYVSRTPQTTTGA
jgi:hypothetical protein